MKHRYTMRHADMPGRLAQRAVLGMSLAFGSALAIAEQGVAPTRQGIANPQIAFDIPAQPLDRAALVFAEQAGVQVFFDSERLQGLQGQALHGHYGLDDGLRRLLGTSPVGYRFDGTHQVTLMRHQESEQTLHLHDINVSGASAAIAPAGAQSTSVVDREKMDRSAARGALDILQGESSVYTASNYQDPSVSVNIRGIQDFGRVNMSIDGMRQNYQESGYQSRNGEMYVDTEFLSSVNIAKGPSSGMGGAGVIGGIADFRTLDADDIIKEGKEYGVRLRGLTGITRYDNGIDFKGSLVAALKMGETLDFLVGVSQTDTDDYKAGKHGDYSYVRWSGTQNGQNIYVKEKLTEVEYAQPWALDPSHPYYQPGLPAVMHFPNILNSQGSGQRGDSNLFKINWNIDDAHRLGLSYMQTTFDYNFVEPVRNFISGYDVTDHDWYLRSADEITVENIALKYQWQPDDPLWNITSSLYRVDTEKEQWQPRAADLSATGIAMCALNPVNYEQLSGKSCYDKQNFYRTITWGYTLQNQALLSVFERELALNYGLEVTRDEVKPQGSEGALGKLKTSLTPEGERLLSGIFLNGRWDVLDQVTLSAGIRYDHYRLQGDVILDKSLGGQFPSAGDPIHFDAKTSAGAWSPTFGVQYRPWNWLELFASAGKGWRPPAVTEVLITGMSPGGIGMGMHPNLYLEPERSRSYEFGFRTHWEGLLTQEDRLNIEVAKYNNHIDNWMVMHIGTSMPGDTRVGGLGRAAFVNRLDPVTIEGVELKVDYDAGGWFARVVASRVETDEGDQCFNPWLYPRDQYPNTNAVNRAMAASPKLCGGTFYAPLISQDKLRADLGVRLFQRRLELGFGVLAFGDQPEDSQGRVVSNSYLGAEIYDAYASLRPVDDFKLMLNIHNIEDRQYFLPHQALTGTNTFPAPGRTVTAAFEYSF
ncbi:TonB-dependent hemoglobin/transferrin/lactoferrin family receptor [Pseudomonas sp. ABC1]|uniref:TonB-dependent receptor n=1 Tax=Pseudomonas sp. ABC1 TaxID=2748080 RepID=UPI0015C33F68|nr:TonB-dependent receptor [Pseudomonas sp. ABC1]QLF93812.1 TonB-dependent hemoglobin/transferrin/lactoferrin family receptor [Pseudomonas sp. ABC1]